MVQFLENRFVHSTTENTPNYTVQVLPIFFCNIFFLNVGFSQGFETLLVYRNYLKPPGSVDLGILKRIRSFENIICKHIKV